MPAPWCEAHRTSPCTSACFQFSLHFDSIGFALVGLNAPLLFGLFCGITDLIPYIGPYIGGAVAVIVGLTQDPLIGIGTLIICVIVQIVESYILQPIVMSKSSNLHPIVIIIALLVFGHFFGILGMVLAPVAARLSELLGQEVKMAKDVVGESAQALAADLKDGEVLLLENVRYEKGETKNDPELSKKFADLAELYVNDAFGSAHRAHSSTAGVAEHSERNRIYRWCS